MKHSEMLVWQSAIELTADIYKLTSSFPGEERYGLTSQMRRSAVSIASNIAEGAGRRTHNEYRQFLYIASGSLSELETQIVIANKLEFIKNIQKNHLLEILQQIRGMIFGVIKFLN